MKFIIILAIVGAGLSAYGLFSDLTNPYYIEITCYRDGKLVYKDKSHNIALKATSPAESRFDKCEIVNVK